MKGLHLVGDLTGCRCAPDSLRSGVDFENKCTEMVHAAGLHLLGSRFHQFEGGGFTGVILLAESHVAVHTWPDQAGVTLDVYVANAVPGNVARAEQLFDALASHFAPTETARCAIERGEHLLMESLNESTGFYIRARRQLGEWRTPHQRMAVYDTTAFGKVFRVDGSNTISEREEFVYHENLVHPTLTAHNAPRSVLIVGGGDGGAAEEVLKHPSVETLTLVESDDAVLRIAQDHFESVHRGVFNHPKLEVVVRDGLQFVQQAKDKYDFIALDLYDDDAAGPAQALFATDVLQRMRQMLAPGGALALHLGPPTAQPDRVGELAQRLNGVFRVVRPYTVFAPLYGAQWAMTVCSDKLDPKAYTADEIDRRIEQRRLQDLRFYNGETHEGVFALPNYLRDLVAPPRLKLSTRGRRLDVVRSAAK
jgi:spermidine synthase